MEDSECDKKCRLEEGMVARRALSNGNAQWSREGRPESMNHFFFYQDVILEEGRAPRDRS